MDPAFRQPPDLTDPAVVAAQCNELAAGMEQQAQAVATGGAMGAPPNRAFVFGRVAEVLTAAAKLLVALPPAQVVTIPPDLERLPPPTGPGTPDAGPQPPAQQKQGGKPK